MSDKYGDYDSAMQKDLDREATEYEMSLEEDCEEEDD